jgi:hypothetical protein
VTSFARPVVDLLRRILGTEHVATALDEIRRLAEAGTHHADSAASKVSQRILAQQYLSLVRDRASLPAFADAEFRAFSQNGEDGILLLLFTVLGMGERRVVEICAGDGVQCNSANLILNHGWTALLCDGNARLVEAGRRFYARHSDTFALPPTFVEAWITRENVNDVVTRHGFSGDVDLLSLDLDGVDYWIWEAIEAIRPRVVLLEFQCLWGAERAVTVPYDPQFRSEHVRGFGVYSGASLMAFVKLARRKGYRFVGVQRLGFNAFFVRDDLGVTLFPEADPKTCLDVPFVEWATRELLPLVRDRPWIDV